LDNQAVTSSNSDSYQAAPFYGAQPDRFNASGMPFPDSCPCAGENALKVGFMFLLGIMLLAA
jgi:hypothetical protein